MEDKKEQIRMLVDTGVPKENILKVLQITNEEFEKALENKEKQEEAEKVTGRQISYTKDLWEEAKAMRDKGATLAAIAVKQGFSMNFISKMMRRNSYEEVEEYRKEQAKTKREYHKKYKIQSRQRNAKQNWYNADKEPATEDGDKFESYVQFMVDVGLVLRDIRDQLTRLADNQGAKPIKKHKFWFK